MADARLTSQTTGQSEQSKLADLFIPWSGRVTFTGEVCGLPGPTAGCWRHRTGLRIPSVPPCQNSNESNPFTAWLLFAVLLNRNSSDHPSCEVSFAQLEPA